MSEHDSQSDTSMAEASTRNGAVDQPEQSAPTQPGRLRPGQRLARNMAFFSVLRLLIVVLITLIIIGTGQLFDVDVPILVAAIIAVVIALPLSMVLFARLRAEINSDIAAVDAGRRAKREDLRRRMHEA